ncbi:non-specific lipid-transfer protein A-like [Telopea speciosissima]|uniref:non-specific lipid-transfer protein A-like n=1 Tax=Telopea speciosissima TaxID=54955 RepID=UPI001CC33754|nr:non-specific lipid-transfer protein A-like [Telopea speciosissima]
MKKMGSGGGGGGSVWGLSLLILVLMMMVSQEVNCISCGDAVSALIPCGSFLLGEGTPKPSAQCCSSAQSLNKLASTHASRVAVCECLKSSAPSFGVKTARAKLLPSLCKLKLNIAINSNTNCKNV